MTVSVLDQSQRTLLEAQLSQYLEAAKADDRTLTYLSGRGWSGHARDCFQIGLRPKDGRLVIPILKQGKPVSFLYRCIEPACRVNTDSEAHEGHPKVKSDPGRRWLFNTDALLDDSTEIDVTEGEPDAITLVDAVGLVAVGIPGVDSWKKFRPVWRRLFEGHPVVRFWKDPGEAGGRLADSFKADVPQAKVIDLPLYDVNKSYRQFGAGYLMEMGEL